MSGSNRPQPERRRADSAALRILASPVAGLGFLLASLVVSIVLELAGMLLWGTGQYWWWPGAGARHSELILHEELEYLSMDLRAGLPGLPTFSQFGIFLSNQLYYFVFQWTGIEAALKEMIAFQLASQYVLAALNAAQIFVIRLTITILAVPLFALFLVWGFTEGLIRRDLRRYGGDIERAYVFHHVKRHAGTLISLMFLLYLTLPFSIHPTMVFLPTAIAFALLIMATSATFIKQI